MNLLKIDREIPSYLTSGMLNYVLVKMVGSLEHAKYLLDGQLYMQNNRSFRNSGTGRDDDIETADAISISDSKRYIQQELVSSGGSCYVKTTEYDKKPADYKENQAFVSYKDNNFNLFCLYTLFMDANNRTLDSIDDKLQSEFGEYCVLIKDPEEFYTRIGAALQKYPEVQEARGGFVKYVEWEQRSSLQRWDCFHKFAADYAHQKEFRLCFDLNVNKDTFEPQLDGDIYDIAVPLRTKTLIRAIQAGVGPIITADARVVCGVELEREAERLLAEIKKI